MRFYGDSGLLLAGILGNGRSRSRIGLVLLLIQNHLARLHIAELLARFFLDDARIAALQGINLMLELLLLHLLLIDLALQALNFGSLRLPNLHAVGAEHDLISNEDGQQGNADSRQQAAHLVQPAPGDANGDLHQRLSSFIRQPGNRGAGRYRGIAASIQWTSPRRYSQANFRQSAARESALISDE